ncbi:hypothetical protein RDI58_028987 [Solanum bulbocastanum]|uniref:Uncharacterized protein n=1 Tax=Solanum bulbocastanum TaxID=147425 RepID=A0AAN8SSZ9_SOLBU
MLLRAIRVHFVWMPGISMLGMGLEWSIFDMRSLNFQSITFEWLWDVVLNLDYNMDLMGAHKNEKALKVMELAILADKKNPLPMYQKANIPLSIEVLMPLKKSYRNLRRVLLVRAVSILR